MTTCSPNPPSTPSMHDHVPGRPDCSGQVHSTPSRRVAAHRAEVAPYPSRALKGLSVLLGTALLVTGCSVPGLPGASGAPEPMERAADVQDSAPSTEPTTADSSTGGNREEAGSPAAPTSATADPEDATGAESPGSVEEAWAPVKTDLDDGSVTHTLSAAARNLVIDYWIEDDVSRLTPDSTPIIRINAHVDGADDGTLIDVTRFNAQVQSLGVDLANDTGSFAINPPYSYMTAVALPANPTAHSTEVLVTFDLLTETRPGSGNFTRQTILDTVSLGYAQPPSATK